MKYPGVVPVSAKLIVGKHSSKTSEMANSVALKLAFFATKPLDTSDLETSIPFKLPPKVRANLLSNCRAD